MKETFDIGSNLRLEQKLQEAYDKHGTPESERKSVAGMKIFIIDGTLDEALEREVESIISNLEKN